MKINRRNFLSLGVGAAAGLAFSPIGIKLMDDSSIWTQNWSWTPVPADGEISYKDSVCSFCDSKCGISVRTIAGRPVKIKGREDYPANDGKICPLGLSGLQLLYSPSRVRTPLKKVGKRDSNKWQEITMDEAIEILSEKLKDIREKGNSKDVAAISGSSGIRYALLDRFFKVYGSRNLLKKPSVQDSYKHLVSSMHSVRGNLKFDFENSDFILSFGTGLFDGFDNPVRMFKVNSNKKVSKATFVQVEPYLSNTAAISDEWLPINPGTEAVLALGIANIIIIESLYDKDFVSKYGKNFNDFKSFLFKNYNVDKVSDITGIETKKIESLARGFARASKPIAVFGRGVGDTALSLNEAIACYSLNLLKGNVDKKGGVSFLKDYNYINWSTINLDDIAKKGLLEGERVDEAKTNNVITDSILNRMPDAINSSRKDAPELLIVENANPVYTMSNTKEVLKSFEKISFIVSFSSFMDETASLSDLIIPDDIYLEKREDCLFENGVNNFGVGLSSPIVKPIFKTENFSDVLIKIAKKLPSAVSNAFQWENYSDCLEDTFDKKWSDLEESGFIKEQNSYRYVIKKNDFAFPKSFFDFMTNFKSASIDGGEEEYPLTLIPADTIRLSSTFMANTPFVTKTVSDKILKGSYSLIQINSETAKKYSLKNGKVVSLTTPFAKDIKVMVNISEAVVPNTIVLYKGLGHKGYDDYIKDKGVNYNELISYLEDKDTGLDVAYGIRAKIV